MSKENAQDSVREEFKKLNLDGKTAFLVEAIFSTAGSAINEIGTRLNGLVSLVTDPFEGAETDDDTTADEAEATAKKAGANAEKAKKGASGSGGSGKGSSASK